MLLEIFARQQLYNWESSTYIQANLRANGTSHKRVDLHSHQMTTVSESHWGELLQRSGADNHLTTPLGVKPSVIGKGII